MTAFLIYRKPDTETEKKGLIKNDFFFPHFSDIFKDNKQQKSEFIISACPEGSHFLTDKYVS